MEPKVRRRHLHESVTAAALYGLSVGLWIGFRGPHAGWLESIAFGVYLLVAPAVVMSRIDAKHEYTD